MIPDSVRTRQIGSTPRSALLSSMNESMTPSGAHTPPGAQTRARPAQDLIGPPPARAPPTPAPRSAAPRRWWFPAGRPDRSRPERAGPPGGRPAPSAILRIAPLDPSGSRRASTAIRVARSRSSSGYFPGALMTVILPCVHRLHQTRCDSGAHRRGRGHEGDRGVPRPPPGVLLGGVQAPRPHAADLLEDPQDRLGARVQRRRRPQPGGGRGGDPPACWTCRDGPRACG